MKTHYSASEVLEIAEKIERNGSAFYYKAAELFKKDENLQKVFIELSEWEKRHQEFFSLMRKRISDNFNETDVFEPSKYMSTNAKLMASLAVFAIKPDPGEVLTDIEDREGILERALKLEKDSITFYQGLKGFAKGTECIKQIDKIIEEEQRHIKILNQSLQQL